MAQLIICVIKTKVFAGDDLRFHTDLVSARTVAGSQYLVCG